MHKQTVNMSVKWKKLAQVGGFGISSKDQIDSSDELHNMKDIEPELFIKFVRIPSLKTYTSLIKKTRTVFKEVADGISGAWRVNIAV